MPTRVKVARDYYPAASSDRNAVRKLRADILRCRELYEKLLKSNPHFDKCKHITYREQRLIWDYLSEPDG